MKKKITVDVRMLESGGIGTYLNNIIPIIIEMEKYDINLIGIRNTIESLSWYREDIPIMECNYPIYSINEQLKLKNFIDRESDLLWSPHFNTPFNYSGKTLVTIHDTFHLAMPEVLNGKVKQIYSKLLYKNAVKKADHIITVSEFSKSEITKYLKRSKDITVIYNGVSEDWFKVEKENNLEYPYIIFVGNIKPHKNLSTLLKAFKLVMEKIPHKLIIVGKKDGFITGEDTLVEETLTELGDRIIFTGFISDEELRINISGASMLIYPSKYEGFGLPPLEAMACKTPTIVSNVASIPEVCDNASLYFDPNNYRELSLKILELINDKKLRSKIIKNGQANSLKYTWRKSADQHVNLIEELIDK